MATTQFSATQAATRARQYVAWATNQCLGFVRSVIHPPGRPNLPDARAAYNAATQKVSTGTPPAGAPVYWKTFVHPYWHIAVSVGNGYVRSTDWPKKGEVGTVKISDMTQAWGMQYLGWSRDYAGLPIPGLEASAPKPTPQTKPIPVPPNYSETSAIRVDDEALRPGKKSEAARVVNARIWSWLYHEGGAAGRQFCIDNYAAWMKEPATLFGPLSVKAMQKMYAILASSNPKGGWTPGATWPGPAFLRRIGLRAD